MPRLPIGATLVALAAIAVASANAQILDGQRAQCESRGGLPELVIAGCTAVIQREREPQANRVSAFNNRGLAYAQMRDYARAIADYDEAIRLDRRHAKPFANRGDAYSRQRDFTHAISDFDQAIRIDPQYTPAIFGRAVAYYALRDYGRAIADYDDVIRLDPHLAIAYSNRGNAHHQRQDTARAIADYDEAIQLDPQLVQAFLERGDAYRAQRDYVRAIADYSETIRLDPNSAQALVNRAAAHAARRDYVRAFADYDSADELEPGNGAIQNSRCWNRAMAGLQLDTARAACDRAISLAADDAQRAQFLDTRGFLALKQSRWQDAWADYDAALRQNPGSAHYRFGRGIAARRLGRATEAAVDLARAAQVDSGIAQTYAGYGVTP